MTTAHSHEGGDEACRKLYRVDDPTFVCPSCERTVGYCMGCADDTPDLCDDCWAKLYSESEAAQ